MIKNKKLKSLPQLYKDFASICTLITISQEALDLCCENEKDCRHITVIIDMILDKLKRTLEEFEKIIKYGNKYE